MNWLTKIWRAMQRRLFTRCEECGKGFCSHERPVWFGHEPARLWRAERGLYHDGCLERHLNGWIPEEWR